jgi:hypothetical protein
VVVVVVVVGIGGQCWRDGTNCHNVGKLASTGRCSTYLRAASVVVVVVSLEDDSQAARLPAAIPIAGRVIIGWEMIDCRDKYFSYKPCRMQVAGSQGCIVKYPVA